MIEMKDPIATRVLLIDPPTYTYGNFHRIIDNVISLGLGYIAGVSVERGDDVRVLDLSAEPMTDAELVGFVKKFRPDIIGISVTVQTISAARTISMLCKNASENAKIIIGGPHPSQYPEDTLEGIPEADFIVVGEGEKTYGSLLTAIKSKGNLADVEGIMYRSGNDIIRTGPREYIKNLDDVPQIPYYLFPMEKYKSIIKYSRRHPKHTYSLITSRGCPFQCTFCQKPVFGSKYRMHSAERVIRDIETLVQAYGAKEIVFYDDTFSLDRNRILRICDLILEKGININWTAITRVDLIDFQILKKMKKSGCWQLIFGLESGNQVLLDRIKKGFTLKDVKIKLGMCKDLGICTQGFLIIGLPGETVEMSRKTINYAIELDLDYANFLVALPYKGTEMYETCKKYGKLRDTPGWENYDFLNFSNPIFINDNMTSDELIKVYKEAWKKFYLRPSYIWKQFKRMRTLEDIKRNTNALRILIEI